MMTLQLKATWKIVIVLFIWVNMTHYLPNQVNFSSGTKIRDFSTFPSQTHIPVTSCDVTYRQTLLGEHRVVFKLSDFRGHSDIAFSGQLCMFYQYFTL